MKVLKIAFLSAFTLLAACKEEKVSEAEAKTAVEEPTVIVEEAMLSQQQFDALQMKIDTLSTRLMSGFVAANGQLEVPPQSEAFVTPVIGGNIQNIQVIEGEKVHKGQVLSYLTHPDLIAIQTQYLNVWNDKAFQKKEYARQSKLYEAGVGSGQNFQTAEAALNSASAKVAGLAAQLKQLNISPQQVEKGDILQQIPVRSPIGGTVQKVNIKTGQYVQPQTNMFEIINTEHVHVDLMVFEKDAGKVKKGQKVYFSIATLPEIELIAEIISVGSNFEEEPKAVHVHAELMERTENLVPGMYVRGRIAVNSEEEVALPEAAVVSDAGKYYIFSAEEEGDAWSFKPVEIIITAENGGWVSFKTLNKLPNNTRFAHNNAYYLMAEMRKGEGGHSH